MFFTHRRRRTLLVATAAVSIIGSSVLVPDGRAEAAKGAPATPEARLTAASQAATDLLARLGDRAGAGIHLDGSGRVVVNVTTSAAGAAVRSLGRADIAVRVVRNSTADLRTWQSKVLSLGHLPGTSVGIDTSTNKVVVETDAHTAPSARQRLKGLAAQAPYAIDVTAVPGSLMPYATSYTSGGDKIRNAFSSLFCSLGFNVASSSGTRYFLTAGHCATGTRYWYFDETGEYIADRKQVSFPYDDYAVMQYVSGAVPYGNVRNGTQDITTSRDPYDGEKVARVGAYSTDVQGQVLLTSATVTYDNGEYVTGVIKTSLCALPGDSGGPLYHGSTAIGTLSGGDNGTGSCNSSSPSNTRTYYQPVQEVLNKFGLHVY